MSQYLVINDPQIDGVSIGDILQSDGFSPYTDIINADVYISRDLVELSSDFFQPL